MASVVADLLPVVGDIRRIPAALHLAYLACGRFDCGVLVGEAVGRRGRAPAGPGSRCRPRRDRRPPLHRVDPRGRSRTVAGVLHVRRRRAGGLDVDGTGGRRLVTVLWSQRRSGARRRSTGGTTSRPRVNERCRPDRPAYRHRMGTRPTIYDVAREAGVAASTVSRAYARPGRVNAETAQRHLRGGRADRLPRRSDHRLARPAHPAVALDRLRHHEPLLRGDHPGADEAVRQAGYTMLLSHTRSPPGGARLDRARARPRRGRAAGQLAHVRHRDPDDRQAEAAGPAQPRDPEVSCVVTDNARGMRRAVEHLAELGHETVTYVAGPEASWADGMRWRALREAAHELELRVRRVGPRDVPTVRTGHAAARRVADDGRQR